MALGGMLGALTLAAPQEARAAVPPSIIGVCAFAPSAVTLHTSPIPTVPGPSLSMTITGSGTCASNRSVNSVTLNLAGNGVFSCAGGTASLSGAISWSDIQPVSQTVSVVAVFAPGTVSLLMTSTALTASADLAWSDPVALATCPLGAVSIVGLAGAMAYTWG